MFDDQLEILQDFVQESRDMLDQLEPTIIELGQNTRNVECWEELKCAQDCACHRYGKTNLRLPCWLDTGYIGEGKKTCPYSSSEKDCLTCPVFTAVNGDLGTMNAIFRLFHSMKGSAGFLEMTNIARVAHAAENLLDLIRSGKIRMQTEHVNLLCQSCDFAREALDAVESTQSDQSLEAEAETVSAKLKKAIDQALELIHSAVGTQGEEPPQAPAAIPSIELTATLEMIERFVQESDDLLQVAEQELLRLENPTPEIFASLFRAIHSFKGNSGFFGFKDLEQLSHAMETVLQKAREEQNIAHPTAQILLEALDVLRTALVDLSSGQGGVIPNLQAHIQPILATIESAEQTPEPVESVLGVESSQPITMQETPAQSPAPRTPAPALSQPPKPAPSAQPSAPVQKQAAGPKPPVQQAAVNRQDIRVDLTKLDQLINLIGELVIAENMLVHNPDINGLELENFNKSAQQMSKIVRELQEVAMTIRMVPVSGLFRRMIRLVHDLSAKSGKKVELQLSGEQTELDKTVIETITDPLVHLLRNSLDHGLEPPSERLAAGKSEKGVVKLTARHEQGEVWITIEDDGRGLNKGKILSKAISKGLVEGDGSDMSDKAICNLIFQPGFSTADQITDVSGRGVGMDVVKQNLEKIKGKIEVQSELGKGCRINLKIPLTLGIIDGMMVRVGQSRCIVPTLSIREAFRPVPEAITIPPDGKEVVRVRESFFPVIRLSDVLSKPADATELPDGILIVLENQDSGIALFVDEILGQQQTVIKALSEYIGNVRAASGCTILGDGEVCLILDVGYLVDSAENMGGGSL